MFSELIYTRCRQGIDILKGGKPITTEGYKVFSCTPSLLGGGACDLPFLLNAAQAKQPCSDPSFMDDAYLYLVPDTGDCFMVDFHPVPFDADARGDYSHRAGNFINQILIGNFTWFYPFEMFGDASIWNAKARGEAYYYENAPVGLPPRSDVSDPAGRFGLDEIGAFISDGRKEALMCAVAFLIGQYGRPPEERRFLVVRDDSSEKIEMWIAAIEHAFSPRMAASVPFATRMDKFATANRYAVNQSGAFQAQINLQDRTQRIRNRAMVVGVDERDRANAASARPLANSPFALLDGKEKRAMFEADTSHRYYRFITGFGDAHQSFCREFLQTIGIAAPGEGIYELYDAYSVLEGPSLPGVEAMERVTDTLGKYSLFKSGRLRVIYGRVSAELPRFLEESPQRALRIIGWLLAVSRVIGDGGAARKLTRTICEAFTDRVYVKPDADRAIEFWQSIRASEFAEGVAEHFLDPATQQSYEDCFCRFSSADVVAFTQISIDCTSCLGPVRAQDLQELLSWSLSYCCENGDDGAARKILGSLSLTGGVNARDMLFAVAGSLETEWADFIVMLIVECDGRVVASDSEALAFVRRLHSEGLGHLTAPALKSRIRALAGAAEIDRFARLLESFTALGSDDMAGLYEALDERLDIAEKGSSGVALAIQQNKPQDAVCANSAHLYALEALDDSQKRADFASIFNELNKRQGFPSLDDRDYIRTLVDRLSRAQLGPGELEYVVNLFSGSPPYISELAETILAGTTPKKNDEWNTLMNVAARNGDPAIYDAVLNGCLKLKHVDRALDQLLGALTAREAQACFRHLAGKAREMARAKKPQSGFGLFGGKK